jgi:hypothetical protein
MTNKEFNEKWKKYIAEGFEGQGLEFDIPSVTVFLDAIFTDLCWIPAFHYSQIKLKFNMCRFYASVGPAMQFLIESRIDYLVAVYDAEKFKAKINQI